jgi:hypothetical protein
MSDDHPLADPAKPFILCAWRSTPCAVCDADENGIHNRVDHGCVVEVEIAAHKTLRSARMHGGRIAKDGTPVTVYEDGEARWSL